MKKPLMKMACAILAGLMVTAAGNALVPFRTVWAAAPYGELADGSSRYLNLVSYWAPTVYQDVNDDYGYRADVPVRFDYDGDWSGLNNWENLDGWQAIPSVYYSVRETQTHYFIEYDFYYPRDDGPISLEQHENDMEGCLLMISKDGDAYGTLQLMETQAHNHWYQYRAVSAVTNGCETIDGSAYLDGHRPKLYISANGLGTDAGHAVWAWGNRYGSDSAPGGDGILLRYTDGAAAYEPTEFGGNYTHTYPYDLVSMDALWKKAHEPMDVAHPTYAKWGVFRGDNGSSENACTLPWVKDDPDDGQNYAGIYWSDPAFFVDNHINGISMSHQYVFNPYYTYFVRVDAIESEANKDPFNDKSDVYMKVVAADTAQIDNRHWKNNQMPKGQKCDVFWGEYETDEAQQYDEPFHSVYVPAPIGSTVSIQVYDKDGTSGDDSMGQYALTLGWGESATYDGTLSSTGEAKIWAVISFNADSSAT